MPRFARFRALVSPPASEANLGLHALPRARPARALASFALLLCLALLVASCNTTPTLPLPPPVASAGTPDSQGFALVEGQAQALSYVSVLNERTDAGVITRTNGDGYFKARIEAQVGNLLTIWQEVSGEIGELKQTVVPAPR